MEDISSKISDYLSNLSCGEKYWFWFCPESPQQPLIIEPFSQLNAMKTLLDTARSISIPIGAQVCTGIAAISNDGIHQFASPLLRKEMLDVLANFVRQNVDQYPSFAHLRDSRFIVVNGFGRVERILEEPKIWKGIRKPSLQGGIEHASRILRFIQTEDPLWIWVSEDSLGSEPIVVLVPIKDDKKGAHFAKVVRDCRSRTKNKESGLRGTIQRLSNGVLLITTKDSTENIGPKLTSWLVRQGNVLAAQIDGEDVVSALRLGGRDPNLDFTLQSTALSAIQNGEKYLFWFSSETSKGVPLLLLHKSKVALMGLAHEVGNKGIAVRGTVKRERFGLKFSIRKTFPNFLPSLVKWVSKNEKKWPDLRLLIGSRLIISNNNGDIIKRIRDTSAWASLEGK